ncbi:M20/M25/M40 family metallo-hydrolase [Sedimenticola hydrogenitrophicus]|uniref:M20/M25/M40 family metallo-hydrolase n=1 Tax=Sedimenticola hydrogenitrophicus TaxID=2967975 RepID=UPI0021A4D810|nr:M20/M25/M40 family metallo-hydrolase [Sedimenticola hydrogenitrophicus]
MNEIFELRRALHQYPELSGSEAGTAARLVGFFRRLAPDGLLEQLGGHGVAVVFQGRDAGPTVLLRAELDALPVHESEAHSDRSRVAGVGHQCGHDGHMAILADPRFAALAPDFAFALHNLPGFPLGQVILRSGAFSSASRGIGITLNGATAHAAQPETGVSPAGAMCRIIEGFSRLSGGAVPAEVMAFGTAPGRADIWATLRAGTDQAMAGLIRQAEAIVTEAAAMDGLDHAIEYDDVFPATVNAPRAVEIVRACAGDDAVLEIDQPFRWSEDFGHFTATCQGALFGLGAGTNAPDLHDHHYAFPEALLPIGAELFLRVVWRCLSIGANGFNRD